MGRGMRGEGRGQLKGSLLDLRSLENSPTVANCRMNREREIRGTNSYAADLGFDVIQVLSEKLQGREAVAWLDVCCGSGQALIQAAGCFRDLGLANRVSLLGLDLVDMFAAMPAGIENLPFAAASAHVWKPTAAFDLVTCVHGLHYVGDKLDLDLAGRVLAAAGRSLRGAPRFEQREARRTRRPCAVFSRAPGFIPGVQTPHPPPLSRKGRGVEDVPQVGQCVAGKRIQAPRPRLRSPAAHRWLPRTTTDRISISLRRRRRPSGPQFHSAAGCRLLLRTVTRWYGRREKTAVTSRGRQMDEF